MQSSPQSQGAALDHQPLNYELDMESGFKTTRFTHQEVDDFPLRKVIPERSASCMDG